MRRAKKIKINHNSEFDLDLAPLLAVMVKLVPVLLISSAFVQMMVIETELPQVVSEAIQKQENDPIQKNITLDVDPTQGFTIDISQNNQSTNENIPLKNGLLDFEELHKHMVAIKKLHPEIFKLDLNPDAKIAYKDIVKITDELRQAHDPNIKFPVFDSKKGKVTETPFMFPQIIFANMMEGTHNGKTTSL